MGGAVRARRQGPGVPLLSQFPLVPLVVLLELAAWVLLALALIGRPRRTQAPSVLALPADLQTATLTETVTL